MRGNDKFSHLNALVEPNNHWLTEASLRMKTLLLHAYVAIESAVSHLGVADYSTPTAKLSIIVEQLFSSSLTGKLLRTSVIT